MKRPHLKISPKAPKLVEPALTATTTDNGHSLNEECLVTHGQFDKLQRDLNQIKEAFRKLKNFEHDAVNQSRKLNAALMTSPR